MKAPPKDWPRMSSALVYRDVAGMIDWLCKAFDFELRIKVVGANDVIEHCELTYGESLIMLSGEKSAEERFGIDLRSPLSAGCTTQALMFYVDDVDAHHAKALSHGGRITQEPTEHDYGDDYWSDRGYSVLDPENQLWWFTQRLRTGGQ